MSQVDPIDQRFQEVHGWCSKARAILGLPTAIGKSYSQTYIPRDQVSGISHKDQRHIRHAFEKAEDLLHRLKQYPPCAKEFISFSQRFVDIAKRFEKAKDKETTNKIFAEVNELNEEMTPVVSVEEERLTEKVRFFKRLKSLKSRILSIENAIVSPKKIYGNPVDPSFSNLLGTFSTSKAETIKYQNSGEFAAANKGLDGLEKAVNDIERFRLNELDSKIKAANTPDTVKDLIDVMAPNEIVALGSTKQAKFMEILRGSGKQVCNLCGTDWNASTDCPSNSTPPCLGVKTNHVANDDHIQARQQILDAIGLQPEFVQKDKEFRRTLVDVFTKGKGKALYEEARSNWETWKTAQRFDFLNKAIALQCEVYGHELPKVKEEPKLGAKVCKNTIYLCGTVYCSCPVQGHPETVWIPPKAVAVGNDGPECPSCNALMKVTRVCKNHLREWPGSPKCPECGQDAAAAFACDTEWPKPSSGNNNCPSCGADAIYASVDFGGCDFSLLKGGGQSIIELNPHENVIVNFNEVFNTIMHENAHNFQIQMVKHLRAGTLPKQYEDIRPQIEVWSENIHGYVQVAQSEQIYMTQPVEAHAWKVGNKMQAAVEQQRLGFRPPKKLGEIKDESSKKLK